MTDEINAGDSWPPDQLERIDQAEELEIAPWRADGTLQAWVPVWVVCADDQVYVRTWHRRDSGWYGSVLRSLRARIRVPGVEREVSVQDVGGVDAVLRASLDAAYRSKYGRYGNGTIDQMTTDDAAASSLRLVLRRVGGVSSD